MKFALIFVLLCSSAFATEVTTDCPAMNGSREKIVKDGSSGRSRMSSKVVRQ